MKKNLIYFLALAIIFSSCQKSDRSESLLVDIPEPQPLTASQIDQLIMKSLEKNSRFEWKDVGTDVLWSAGKITDQIYAVGYKPVNESDVDDRMASIDIQTPLWKETKQQILQLIYEEEKSVRPDLKIEGLEVWPETVLPVMDIRIERYSTLQKLKASGLIRYVEPMGYEYGLSKRMQFRLNSSSGCGSNVAATGSG